MKITKSHLRKIIKEEVSKVLSESPSLAPHDRPSEKNSWQDWVRRASKRTDPEMRDSDLNNAVEVFIHHNEGDAGDLRVLAGDIAEEYHRAGFKEFAAALRRYMKDVSFRRFQPPYSS